MRFSILLESIYMGNTHTKLLLYLGEIVKVYFLFNTTFRYFLYLTKIFLLSYLICSKVFFFPAAKLGVLKQK